MVSFRKSLDSETLGTHAQTYLPTPLHGRTQKSLMPKFKDQLDKSDKCITVLIRAPALPALNLQGQRQGEEVGLGTEMVEILMENWLPKIF